MLRSRLSVPVALTAAALLALSGCGGGDEDSLGAEASPSASAATPSSAAEPSPQECPLQAKTVPAPAGSTKDLDTKPTVAGSKAPPPKDVTVADIVVGTGPEAKTLSQVEVQYLGAFYETGKEFDSSWSRNKEPLPFTVCAQGVVPGFSIAPTGMKVGGRRQVTIPGEYAYGAQGQGDIPPNATLVFVIDLVKVTD